MALEQLVLIFPIGWSHLFSAGIVSPIAITATAESPALGRHFVFTIQLEKCSPNSFKFDGKGEHVQLMLILL